VAEDERQRERTPDAEPTTAGTESLDRSAEAFLDLESDLADTDDDLPADLGYGLVTDAERVSAADVPADYPWTVTGEEAVALMIEHGRTGRTVTAYFAWPPREGDRLDRLLAAAGIDDGFARLHGAQVLLTTRDGTIVPFVPPTRPRGSAVGRFAVLGGLVFNSLTLLGVAFGVGFVATLGFLAVFLAVNFLAVPAGTFLDGRYLRSHTDWGQGPSFWALLSAFPFLNVLTSVAYLRSRAGTRPIVK